MKDLKKPLPKKPIYKQAINMKNLLIQIMNGDGEITSTQLLKWKEIESKL